MDETMRLEDFVDGLREIKTHKEFRKFCDVNLMNQHEMPDYRLSSKLKQDVAGALFNAIHGSTDNEQGD
jgi:hypothetical protein